MNKESLVSRKPRKWFQEGVENSTKCHTLVAIGFGNEELIGDPAIGGLNGGRGGSQISVI